MALSAGIGAATGIAVHLVGRDSWAAVPIGAGLGCGIGLGVARLVTSAREAVARDP